MSHVNESAYLCLPNCSQLADDYSPVAYKYSTGEFIEVVNKVSELCVISVEPEPFCQQRRCRSITPVVIGCGKEFIFDVITLPREVQYHKVRCQVQADQN